MIRVVDAGLLTTVQDCGRWGSQDLGVPVSGPMDLISHRVANMLVGNDSACATLEVTLVGPEIEFLADTMFVVVGGEFELWLGEDRIPVGSVQFAHHGRRLRFGHRTAGARAYLAIAGGIDVPFTLGSRSTDLASGLGGRLLRAGDKLNTGSGESGTPVLRGNGIPFDLPRGGATLRCLVEQDVLRFDDEVVGVFADATYTVGPDSNRMGYRLIGPKLEQVNSQQVLSNATPMGTVQVPPSGQPILLMADRQTIGGYPRIASVISVDQSVAGQLAPGDWIRFEFCSRSEAVEALIAVEQTLLQWM